MPSVISTVPLFHQEFRDGPLGPWSIDPWCLDPQRVNTLGQSGMELFSKYSSNLRDHDTSTSQTDRQTDGRAICRGNTALCVASRGKSREI